MFSKASLLIRADAAAAIGTGHVMRCLALAQGWRDRGGKVIFAGHIAGHSLRQRIKSEGFGWVEIARPFPDPADLDVILALLKENSKDHEQWVVVDGYHFTADYTSCLREAGARVLLFDDYAHQEKYQTDLLLNQNVGGERLHYSINEDAVILAGSEYVLLRREFLRDNGRETRAEADVSRHILVTMGGSDPENATMKVIDALARVEQPGLDVKIVVGPVNQNRDFIARNLAERFFKAELLSKVEGMASLLKWADVAITSGGTTCWEAAYLGIPALIISVAENQLGVARGMAEAGAGWDCGQIQALSTNQLAGMINILSGNNLKRQEMARAGRQLVDGRGTMRVINRMAFFPFGFRPVTEDDCRLLFDWANDPVVRKSSFSSDKIAWQEHQKWFAAKLHEADIFFWIVLGRGGQPVGQVRFHVSGDEAVISISLRASMRNKGQGSMIIRAACARLWTERQNVTINAFVRKDNRPSAQAFGRAGFVDEGEQVMYGVPAVKMRLAGQGQ